MASTSHGGQVAADAANPTSSENSAFDWNPGSMAFRRNELVVYNQLLEGPDCNIGTTSATTANAVSPTSVTDLFQIPVNGEQDAVANSTAPMQLLNQAAQEARQQMAALFEIYPEAKVEGDRISAIDYVVVLKLFLFHLTLSETGIGGMPHRVAYACLLLRLSREIGTCYYDQDSKLDPADYLGCLGELLKDMEQTWKTLETDRELLIEVRETLGPDICVYVRRETGNYTRCLLAAADALNLLQR